MQVLVDSGLGVYIPQTFAQIEDLRAWGVTPEQEEILLAGPEHEHYWDVWDEVLYEARLEEDGKTYYLFQDGDLFMVAEDEDPYDEYDASGDFE